MAGTAVEQLVPTEASGGEYQLVGPKYSQNVPAIAVLSPKVGVAGLGYAYLVRRSLVGGGLERKSVRVTMLR